MKYRVTFTGDTDPEYIEEDKANALMNALSSKVKPEYIQIGNKLAKATTIRSVEPQTIESNFDARKEDFERVARETNETQWRTREARMRLSTDKRARVPEVLSLAWWAITGQTEPPPDEALKEIFLASELYLQENPDRSFANPICYRYVLERYRPVGDSRSGAFVKNSMALVERILREDR